MAWRKTAAALVFVAVGVAMMIYGVLDGEAAIVMRKAAAVCLECIGVG